jgi:hemolysin activation/secretion protein
VATAVANRQHEPEPVSESLSQREVEILSQKLKQPVSERPVQRATALQVGGQLHAQKLSQAVTEIRWRYRVAGFTAFGTPFVGKFLLLFSPTVLIVLP